MFRLAGCLPLIAVSLLMPAQGSASASEPTSVPFDSERWVSRGRIVEHLGRPAFAGRAMLDGVDIADGVIEVDVAVSGARSYPGVFFHARSLTDHESVYLRPHIFGVFDTALQYTPVVGGSGLWQLYSGPGFTAAADLPGDTWVTMRVEFRGTRARVFLGDDPEPALVIPELRGDLDRGSIGVSCPPDGSAYFSNFRYHEAPELEIPRARPSERAPGTITSWQVAGPYRLSQIDLERHPTSQGLDGIDWRDAQVERDGLVNLSHLLGRQGREPDVGFAKTVIEAESPRRLALSFGYSDVVAVFHNERLVFAGSSSYRQRGPLFQGVIGLFDTVYLPLEAGPNEILFAVAEGFGGWGLVARDGDANHESAGWSRVAEIEGPFHTPESVLYDPQRRRYYVTNVDVYGRANATGGQYLLVLDEKLRLLDERLGEGLRNPVGLVLVGERLFVVERGGVAELDPSSGEILARHEARQAGFLNDITLGADGTLYVSDSAASRIFSLRDGILTEWLGPDEIGNPNAIWAQGSELILSDNAANELVAYDLETRARRRIASLPPGNIDGLRPDGHGGWIVGHWEGRVYRIDASGDVERLLDLSGEGANICDFEYRPEEGLLVLPTFVDDRVLVYRRAP